MVTWQVKLYNNDFNIQPTALAEKIDDSFNSKKLILTGSAWEYALANPPTYIKSSPTLTGNPQDLFFSPDGLKLFYLDSGTDTIYEHSLSEAFNIDTLNTTPNASINISDIEASPYGIFLNPDGTKLFFLGSGSKRVYSYDLSVAWSLLSYSSLQESSQLSSSTFHSITFKPDGQRIYIVNSTRDSIEVRNLSIPWDVTSISSIIGNISIAAQETSPTGVTLSSDGMRIFIIGSGSDKVFEYNLNTAYGVSATYSGNSFDLIQNVSTGLQFSTDGYRLFVIGSTTDKIDEFAIAVPFSLSTDVAFSEEKKESYYLKTNTVAGNLDAKLEIGYKKDESSDVSLVYLSKEGNLGLGKVPTEKLDIDGNIKGNLKESLYKYSANIDISTSTLFDSATNELNLNNYNGYRVTIRTTGALLDADIILKCPETVSLKVEQVTTTNIIVRTSVYTNFGFICSDKQTVAFSNLIPATIEPYYIEIFPTQFMAWADLQ